MYCIFMDNYRGFTKTLVPLRRANFLVGENSTGKSSFLSLIHILSNPSLFMGNRAWQGDKYNLGGFRDIVSVTSRDKSYFTIGTLLTKKKRTQGKTSHQQECAFSLLKYGEDEGVPSLTGVTYYDNNSVTDILFEGHKIYFRVVQKKPSGQTGQELRAFLETTYSQMPRSKSGLELLSDELATEAPLGIIFSLISNIGSATKLKKNRFTFNLQIPGGFPNVRWTWLAPIRTRPKRIYDPFKTEFTPEGEHTPYVIRKSLDSQDRADRFVKLLATFGEASGLFSGVKVHSFGSEAAAPFEVLIELHGNSLNIANVGYGVSQVLPLIVEMITQPKETGFTIQQPEVHLHPRAQAALGDLIYFLIDEENHHYLIETHSDYMIDRFRLCIKRAGKSHNSQVLFFERADSGNKVHLLPMSEKGQYPSEQPDGFRRFFINEEITLLEI
jgi:hypothetical protein